VPSAAQVSTLDSTRQTVTSALVLLAILILIPFTPDAPEMLDVLPMVMMDSVNSGPPPLQL
jgi:hypothetical protein